LPWIGQTDPYKIWLSEIILQQTRVEQGLPYYLKFVDTYPTVGDLAEADEDEVFKLWQGLGYYSRARNMLAAARKIHREFNGEFPDTYEEIRALPGVGDYTAAAISSFAFGLTHPSLDGNVYRLLSRYFGIVESPQSSSGKKYFKRLAEQLIKDQDPARWNQAAMDFGSLQCKPRKPLCDSCPLDDRCEALKQDRVEELPVKIKAKPKRQRYMYFLVLESPQGYWLRKRSASDVWRGLYEYPNVELEEKRSPQEVLKGKETQGLLNSLDSELHAVIGPEKQTLSHQHIWAFFLHLRTKKSDLSTWADLSASQPYTLEQLRNLALPRVLSRHFEAYLNAGIGQTQLDL
jgi:A/G-specific adenine glycosylase